jgi:hypothetical protein
MGIPNQATICAAGLSRSRGAGLWAASEKLAKFHDDICLKKRVAASSFGSFSFPISLLT